VEANGAYLRLVGRTADALRGRPLSELVVGGPLATNSEWVAAMDGRRFNGEAEYGSQPREQRDDQERCPFARASRRQGARRRKRTQLSA
jgi:hypothetical protein